MGVRERLISFLTHHSHTYSYAGGRGFEPRLTPPKSAVLPLNDPPLISHYYIILGECVKVKIWLTLYRLAFLAEQAFFANIVDAFDCIRDSASGLPHRNGNFSDSFGGLDRRLCER